MASAALKAGFLSAHGSTEAVEHLGRLYVHVPSPIKKAANDDQRLLAYHSGQSGPFRSKARFRVIVAGRRWGKTHWTCIELLSAAVAKPKQNCWYLAPTFSMAKQIAWEKLKEIIPLDWIKKIHENTLTITLKNRSKITLRGADRPDNTRGVSINFLVLDEFQDMKREIWTAIRPTLTDTKGRAIFIGTPKSYNHLYEMWKRGQPNEKGHKNPQWDSWQFKTSSSPFIGDDELLAARRDMDPKMYRQEYEATFESVSGRVYYDFDRTHNVRPCPFDPNLPVIIGQDFNIDPMCGVIFQEHGNEIWATGEMVLRTSTTEDVCRNYIEEFGWDIRDKATIYPDPAGNQRQHARGDSDIAIFREWGFNRILFRPKAPLVRDRIASVNRLICDATGRRRLFVDPSCKTLIQCFEQLIYKEGTTEPDKSMNIEHIGDAAGYPLEYRYPVKRVSKPMGLSR